MIRLRAAFRKASHPHRSEAQTLPRTTFHPALSAAPLLLLALLHAAPTEASDIVVNTTADAPDTNAGDGACTGFGLPPLARCTLRAAIMEANAQGGAHVIRLPAGTYGLDRVGSEEENAFTGDLDIRADITLVNISEETVRLGQSMGERFFDVHPGGRLVLERLELLGGEALQGERPQGGAVFVWHGGLLMADRVRFAQNRAASGGAVFVRGDALIERSDLHDNFLVSAAPDAGTQGTAIFVERTLDGPARLQLSRSSLTHNGLSEGENHVGQRYALAAAGATEVQLLNTSVIDNSRGIWSFGGGRLGLLHATLARNDGFALRFDHDPNDASPQLMVAFTAITANGGVSQCRSLSSFFLNPNIPQLMISNLHNASEDVSCGFEGANDVALEGWPFHPERMQSELTRYYQPVPGRGLVDTGGVDCEADLGDQRGGLRPLDGSGQVTPTCDIGAIEFDPLVDLPMPAAVFSDGFED